jgi:hypothetical protein
MQQERLNRNAFLTFLNFFFENLENLKALRVVVAGGHGQIPFLTIWRLQISKIFSIFVITLNCK